MTSDDACHTADPNVKVLAEKYLEGRRYFIVFTYLIRHSMVYLAKMPERDYGIFSEDVRAGL